MVTMRIVLSFKNNKSHFYLEKYKELGLVSNLKRLNLSFSEFAKKEMAPASHSCN